MDFLEDLELYNRAMDNAYFIITRRKTLDDIYYNLENYGKIPQIGRIGNLAQSLGLKMLYFPEKKEVQEISPEEFKVNYNSTEKNEESKFDVIELIDYIKKRENLQMI